MVATAGGGAAGGPALLTNTTGGLATTTACGTGLATTTGTAGQAKVTEALPQLSSMMENVSEEPWTFMCTEWLEEMELQWTSGAPQEMLKWAESHEGGGACVQWPYSGAYSFF